MERVEGTLVKTSTPVSGACLALLLPLTAAAQEFAPGPGHEHEHEVRPDDPLYFSGAPLDPSFAIDCAESKDTGYVKGEAFEITVVTVDNKKVELHTANAYHQMQQAAAKAGVNIAIVSGFRTMSEQQYLYGCYQNCNCNNCNLAAKPGFSNHQSGHALDLNTGAAGVLNWLNNNGPGYGFTRTVPSEDWHWEWWGGGPPASGPCGEPPNEPPKGYLDEVQCDMVRGWAFDPETGAGPIGVSLSFGGQPEQPGTGSIQVVANVERPDLCPVVGSCDHGFEFTALPRLLMDNQPHPVHARAVDPQAGPIELASSPKEMLCPPPPLPAGVRRHVINPDSLMAWKFSIFWQSAKVDDPTLLAVPEWKPMPAVPQLVRVEGAPEVWLIDEGFRRHVPDPQAAAAWQFDLSTPEVWDAAALMALPEGPPLRATPFLVIGDGPALYVIDDPLCLPEGDVNDPQCPPLLEPTTGDPDDPTSSSGEITGDPGPTSGPGPGGSSSSSGGDASGTGTDSDTASTAGQTSDAGCGCRTGSPWSPALGLLGLLGLLRRRRAPR